MKLGIQHTRRHWQPLSVHLWAYCTHPTHDVSDVMWCVKVGHTTRVYVPYTFRTVVWVLLRATRARYVSVSAVRQDLFVFHFYPKGLESLTACRFRYKGSTFFSVVLRLWVLVQPGSELTTSRSAVWRSPNWANQAAVSSPIFSFTDLEVFLRLIYPRA